MKKKKRKKNIYISDLFDIWTCNKIFLIVSGCKNKKNYKQLTLGMVTNIFKNIDGLLPAVKPTKLRFIRVST